MVERAAEIGQENMDERERLRLRLEEQAEMNRINMILQTYEEQRSLAD